MPVPPLVRQQRLPRAKELKPGLEDEDEVPVAEKLAQEWPRFQRGATQRRKMRGRLG
jgi:hypothetical protein